MTTLTIGVTGIEAVRHRVSGAFAGESQGSFIGFATIELLWRTMTTRRWDILRAMTARGPIGLRAIARAVGKDVKTTHGDVHALLDAGILERTADGAVVFDYEAVHVDFTITRAA